MFLSFFAKDRDIAKILKKIIIKIAYINYLKIIIKIFKKNIFLNEPKNIFKHS